MHKRFDNLDVAESLYLNRQLESVARKTYEIKVPFQKVRELIPTDNSLPPGTKAFSYRVYDQVGAAKIIAAYSDDLPRADVLATEVFGRIRLIGDSYGYSIIEVQAGAQTGVSLEQRKANAARRAIEEKINSIAIIGDSQYNVLGLLNQPNVTSYVVPNGAGGVGTWFTGAGKTPNEILADMFGASDAITNATLNTEKPNTLLMPVQHYSYISRTRIDPLSTETILSFFLKTSQTINQVEAWADLATAGVGGSSRMVAYDKSPDAIGLIMPREFEQLQPEKRNLEYVVDCIAETGGVVVYYPLSMVYVDGA